MKMYLIVSCILILLQVTFAGPFFVAGFLGQMNFGKWTQGWGFGNTHIWAGGTIAWMLSIILTRYTLSHKEKLSISTECFYLCSMGLGAVGLFYTLNRGAWVGMFLAMLVLAWVFSRSDYPLRSLFKGLAVMFIFVSVCRLVIHPDVYKMREKMSFLQNVATHRRDMLADDAATLTRFKAWGVAFDGIRENPFWGLGVGQFPKYYEKTFPGLFQGLAADKFDPNAKQIPHNSYLYYASEMGMLPAGFLFLFISMVLVSGFRSGVTAAVFPFFIGGVVICVWVLTCDYIIERIFWIALGSVAG
ncbi:MAG: O-antigen ligase family protein, partial [Elusimicrobiota bacterium]